MFECRISVWNYLILVYKCRGPPDSAQLISAIYRTIISWAGPTEVRIRWTARKQGSAADRGDFTPHLGREWTLTSAIHCPCLQDDCFSNTEESTLKGFQHLTIDQGYTRWVRRRCFIYCDDDAVVSAISLIFTGIAEQLYNILCIGLFC